MEFLQNMSQKYEIIIFTASTQYYADAIINHIDPENKYISYVLTRKHCMQTKNGFFIKDLRIIKNRDLKDMVIVDNLLHSFGLQIDNGIPILEFTRNQKDEELKFVQNYLRPLAECQDVREYNRTHLKLAELEACKFSEVYL